MSAIHEGRRDGAGERTLSPISRRVFMAAMPAAGAAALAACGGGGYADVYGDYANCYYCDIYQGFAYPYDYTCCDGRFVCDGDCF